MYVCASIVRLRLQAQYHHLEAVRLIVLGKGIGLGHLLLIICLRRNTEKCAHTDLRAARWGRPAGSPLRGIPARDPGGYLGVPSAVKRAVARHTRTPRGQGGMGAISNCPLVTRQN